MLSLRAALLKRAAAPSFSVRPSLSRSYASVVDSRIPPASDDGLVSTLGNFGGADDVANDLGRGATSRRAFEIRKYKPVSPGIRWLRRPVVDHLWKGRVFLPLTVAKRRTGGRNNTGRITMRHQGGGHKRRLRLVDFRRLAPGQQTVERIEYDPGRSAHIALLVDAHGEKSYILACEGLRAGHVVESFLAGIPDSLMQQMGGEVDPGMLAAKTVQRGNCLPMHMVPVGTVVHALSLRRDGPAKLCRAAGAHAQVITSPRHGYAVVKLQSGELRKVPAAASCTVGIASNADHHHRKLGKAGRSRWLGIRPTVRGVAMNAYEHPHGGGHGGGRGNKPTQSIWGWKTKGYKTRRSVHNQNRFLVKGRPRGKDKNKRA